MTNDPDVDELLAGWDVEGAPPGFADRVLRADAHAHAPAPQRRRFGIVALALVGALAAALALVFAWPENSEDGALRATDRTSLALPHADLVAEAGASLTWSMSPSGVRVEQAAGKVFYRVDPGDAFEVATPLGVVMVRGTCFEVEVESMDRTKRSLGAGALGLAGGVAVVVTLYEGRIVIAGGQGETELRPGQVATLSGDDSPRVTDRQQHARSDHRSTTPRLGELARKRRASATDEQDDANTEMVEHVATDDRRAEIERCGYSINRDGCSNVAPSQAVLDWRADCGIVVFDEPEAFTTARPDFTELAELTGLDAAEREKLEASARAFHDEMRERFVAQYLALGGSPELADQLATSTLFSEVAELAHGSDADGSSAKAIQQMIADARAGRSTAVDWHALPPAQQFMFLRLEAGELFERELAASLGVARARELREARDGWTANRGMVESDGRCFD